MGHIAINVLRLQNTKVMSIIWKSLLYKDVKTLAKFDETTIEFKASNGNMQWQD